MANHDLLRQTDNFVRLVILQHIDLLERDQGTTNHAAALARYAEPAAEPSIYDERASPAPGRPVDSDYCDDPYIKAWWTPQHDALIHQAIAEDLWHWDYSISKRMEAITPPDVLQKWDRDAPKRHIGYNAIVQFARARAQRIGALRVIPTPRRKTCPLCQLEFAEDSLPRTLAVRLGYSRLNVCSPCISDALGHFDGTISYDDAVGYIQDLAAALQCVPSIDFGQHEGDLLDMSDDDRVAVLRVLQRNPGERRIKELFGSWLNALVTAGVLEGGVRRTRRGTQCIAKDGHVCLSLAEKTIDDWLHARGIPHEKEPLYPEGNYRADFAVNGVFVEYLGLAGNEDYDRKTALKRQICRCHGIRLILLYPRDVINSARLDKMLLGALSRS